MNCYFSFLIYDHEIRFAPSIVPILRACKGPLSNPPALRKGDATNVHPAFA